MWRPLIFALTMVKCWLLVYGQMAPGLNLAQILQARTNRLQQMMLDNMRTQGNPMSVLTGRSSPAATSDVTASSPSNVPGTSGSPNLIPIDQLLQQQRNMQSQLLQNVMNFQRSLRTPQMTQSRIDNTLPSQMTGGQQSTGSRNTLTLGGAVGSTDPGRSTASQMTQTSFADMFPTGNASFGGLLNGFSFSPLTSGTFWTQESQTPSAQSTGRGSLSSSRPTSGSTFVPSTGNQGSAGTSFVPTTLIPGSSFGMTFGSGPTVSREMGPSGTRFVPTSANPGSSQQTTFRQTSGAPGFTSSNDLSSAFTTAFDRGPVSGQTGTGSSFSPSIGSGFTSTVNTQPALGPTPTTSQPALHCTEDYQKMSGHTLCLTDSRLVTNGGVSPEDKRLIVNMHNQLRASVQPPAMDLMKLQWDERLAAVANKWARQCTLAHDNERRIPALGMSIGQNVAVGYESWRQAMQQWYDEIRLYRYGVDPDSYLGADGWRQIAHFTQIVQNGTYLIGCGFAVCPTTEYIRFFVCNYAAGQSDLANPYTAGSQCGMCPNNCVNGVCDCGDTVCINKGRLDPSTCTCDCPKPYKGRRCEVLDCPATDNWICGRDWPASFCDRFYNVPEECPIMCGLCPGGSTTLTPEISTVPNVTFISSYGCRYRGARDNVGMCDDSGADMKMYVTEGGSVGCDECDRYFNIKKSHTCRNYGDSGADMKMCATEGGSVGCAECDRYFNIKKDYCPVMCGLCDPPCAGKRCYNGGTLDTRTCQCQCRKPFTGDICDFAQCPVSGDPAFCRFWPPRYCRQYFNVPEECPYMCGICKPDMMSPRPEVAGAPVTGSGANRARTTEGNET